MIAEQVELRPFVNTWPQPHLKREETFLPELEGTAADAYSQFGEDGLIRALFDLIGVANRWCFEVGAADGVLHSNTKCLRDVGWNAVLIESDPESYRKLYAWASPHVQIRRGTVGNGLSLDHALCHAGAPRDLDLGVIDIDGQDYWVWDDMRKHAPRVMLVEYSPYVNPYFLPARGVAHAVDLWTPCRQAGLQPILDLGRSKGYREVAITPVNVLFVKEELLSA